MDASSFDPTTLDMLYRMHAVIEELKDAKRDSERKRRGK